MIVSTQFQTMCGFKQKQQKIEPRISFFRRETHKPNPTPTMPKLSCATVALVASFAAAKAEAPTDRSLPFADHHLKLDGDSEPPRFGRQWLSCRRRW